jgi:hypothetical protein
VVHGVSIDGEGVDMVAEIAASDKTAERAS